MHEAAKVGALTVIEELLEAGQAVDDKDTINEKTPLHYAAFHSHCDLAEWLIEKGADPASMDLEGFTPIFSAITANSLKLTKALFKYKEGWQLETKMKITHHAATQPTLDILEYLHKEGLSLSEEDNPVPFTQTDRAHPIHYAAFKNSYVCLKYLIAQHAHINIQDCQGLSPLHFAVAAKSEACAKALCDAGANVNLKNSVISRQSGISPIDIAEMIRHASLKTMLYRYSKVEY